MKLKEILKFIGKLGRIILIMLVSEIIGLIIYVLIGTVMATESYNIYANIWALIGGIVGVRKVDL